MKGRIFCKNVFKITKNKKKNRTNDLGGLNHITKFKHIVKYDKGEVLYGGRWFKKDPTYPPML